MRLFLYKAKAAVFSNTMTIGKVVALAWKIGRQHGKICLQSALIALFLKKKKKKKQKQSKAIVYSTSQQLWSQLLLHNDYTSENVLDSHNAALWVKKKKNEEESLKFIKENKTSGNQQRATLLLLFMCLPFQIFQHAAIKHQVPVSYKIT